MSVLHSPLSKVRSIRKLPWSTWCVLVAVSLLLLFVNWSAYVETLSEPGPNSPDGPHFYSTTQYGHGWPCTFVTRRETIISRYKIVPTSRWDLSEAVIQFHPGLLVVDILVSIGCVVCCAIWFQRWWRSSSRWQIGLRTFLTLFVVCGLLLGQLAGLSHRHEQVAAKSLTHDRNDLPNIPSVRWQPFGFCWQRDLLGPSPLNRFDQAYGLSMWEERLAELPALTSLKHLEVRHNQTLKNSRELGKYPQLEFLAMYGSGYDVPEVGCELPAFLRLKGLCLYRERVRAPYLGRSIYLEDLGCVNSDLDEATIEAIGTLTRLRSLNLLYVRMPDGKLVRLDRLAELEYLHMSGEQAADAQLSQLLELKKLRELTICGSRVTDQGLATLQRVASLKALALHDTEVTEDGVTKFLNARPGCTVSRRKAEY